MTLSTPNLRLLEILGWPMLISIEAGAVAVGCAIAVCVIFGYYPAHRASALNPLEALRTDYSGFQF